MRFAVTATDRYLDIFKTLVERAWTPVKVFTGIVDNRIHHNTEVLGFAKQLGVEAQISRLTDANLRELAELGCEALIVASYEWRIGENSFGPGIRSDPHHAQSAIAAAHGGGVEGCPAPSHHAASTTQNKTRQQCAG